MSNIAVERTLSIVIPVYNSAETLLLLTDRLTRTMKLAGLRYEIVFVDDASSDTSWDILCRLQSQRPDIAAIQLMRNCGQHNALMCGFRHTSGSLILTLDDDLQHPPEEIPKLLRTLDEGDYDLVYGVPEVKRHGRGRILGSRLINVFFRRLFRTPIPLTSFRVIRRGVLKSILRYDLNFTFIDGLLAWNTDRIGGVTVRHDSRQHGQSGYSVGKLLSLSINLITNFSLAPLQVASTIGIAASLAGLAASAYYLLRAALSSIEVPGYASIIIAVLFLGGVQLLALGVIGEYIGRLHLNMNRKPQYSIRHTLPLGSDPDFGAEPSELEYP